VARQDPDAANRVRFYLLPHVRMALAFGPWYRTDLPDPWTSEVTTWSAFHKQFGRDLNNRIYEDATTHPEWFR